jgi:hypothetical protein
LDEKGLHLAAELLSDVILCLPGSPKLLEQIACGTNFQKSAYPAVLLSDCDSGQ